MRIYTGITCKQQDCMSHNMCGKSYIYHLARPPNFLSSHTRHIPVHGCGEERDMSEGVGGFSDVAYGRSRARLFDLRVDFCSGAAMEII